MGRYTFINLILVGLSSGCGASKVNQCQQMVTVTQEIAVESAKYRQSQKSEEVLLVTTAFDTAAESLEQLHLTDESLLTYQMELAQIYRNHAQVTRDFIAAIAQKDVILAKSLRDRVGQIGQAEKRWITQLNQYCQAD